jgi:hypothetical protein
MISPDGDIVQPLPPDDARCEVAGRVLALATLPVSRHVFNDPVSVPAHKTASGRPQTERTCKLCPVVKVTLRGGDHGRAWRTSADAAQVETFDAPPCVPKVLASQQ